MEEKLTINKVVDQNIISKESRLGDVLELIVDNQLLGYRSARLLPTLLKDSPLKIDLSLENPTLEDLAKQIRQSGNGTINQALRGNTFPSKYVKKVYNAEDVLADLFDSLNLDYRQIYPEFKREIPKELITCKKCISSDISLPTLFAILSQRNVYFNSLVNQPSQNFIETSRVINAILRNYDRLLLSHDKLTLSNTPVLENFHSLTEHLINKLNEKKIDLKKNLIGVTESNMRHLNDLFEEAGLERIELRID